nr:hypothetical protein [Pandoravirus massiliensis]
MQRDDDWLLPTTSTDGSALDVLATLQNNDGYESLPPSTPWAYAPQQQGWDTDEDADDYTDTDADQEDQVYADAQGQVADFDGSADLVDLMGEDVFIALLQSLVAQGRAGDVTALCSSSQRARDLCQRARVNWTRYFPELVSAYGGGGDNEAVRDIPTSAAAPGMTGPSVLQTALAMRRQRDARLAQQRFCVLYALYVQAETRRVALERQRAHALDLESGAAMQTARDVARARAEIQSSAAAGRSSRSPGRAFGRILRGMVPSRGSRSALRSLEPREVAPHLDVADVLRSPADMTLGDLLQWARSVQGVSGYVLGGFEDGVKPWHVVQLGDEPPVPYGDPRLRYFYVASMDPPSGTVASLDDRRLIGRDSVRTVSAILDRAAARPDVNSLRIKVERAVDNGLKRALTGPRRARFAPEWARRRGVPRPERSAEEEDASLATLRALDRLVERCTDANLFEAFAPVSTYLAARPFGATNDITYDIIVGLPIA